MDPVTRVSGIAAPLPLDNVDTDQIIPAVWMKRTEKYGYEDGLFERWRADPDFVLNDPNHQHASILLAGENFGCGSSREHAPWALRDYGFRAVLAVSFADIFRTNMPNVGLIPGRITRAALDDLVSIVGSKPRSAVTIDLPTRTVRCDAAGLVVPFVLDDSVRHRLMAGHDLVDQTLVHTAAIHAFEQSRPLWMPQSRS